MESGSFDPALVGSYMREDVSSSVVYLLTLFQPLNRAEILKHPFRSQYLRLRGSGEPRDNLGDALERGQESGLLVALTDGRESYFFLNSDLVIRPPPLPSGEEIVEVDTSVERHGELCLPDGCRVGRDHPIPRLKDPSALLGWFQWLSDDARRELLLHIQETGPVGRDEIDKVSSLDDTSIQAGLRCGILKAVEEGLDFQFSAVRIPPDGDPWTSKPPKFWLSRSYGPLRCVEGLEGRAQETGTTSPMQLLAEAIDEGRRVRPSKRVDHLELNLLYRATAVVPRIEDLGPETIPTAWENRRGLVFPVTEGHERALATHYLHDELQEDEGTADWRREALRRLARRKLERYFQAREEEVMARISENRESGYGLGPHAILSVANKELEREGILAEKKYFERFLELLAE